MTSNKDTPSEPVSKPEEAAQSAGLRYVSDDAPGLVRKRRGKIFIYTDAAGARVRAEATLARIRALAIPPAWTRVWICPLANGHLQATGRDARGRKQYRYHARWRAVRDESKYDRVLLFAQALPKIRVRCEQHLALPGLPREKLLATVVSLLERTLIRVGNEQYARQNRSFGLTTLREKHVEVKGATVRFHFRGKSGVNHAIDLHDRRLARIVARCQALPGHELFRYLDDQGAAHTIESGDVNDYLREAAGDEFSAKDFRTWYGTVLAAEALARRELATSEAQAKRSVTAALEQVAARLGNTVTVCRKCYVHPEVLSSYLEGELHEVLGKRPSSRRRKRSPHELSPTETAVLALLQRRVAGPGDLARAA